MKFFKLFLILPVFFAGLAAPAFAQTKVGVINQQRVLAQSVVGQHIATRLGAIQQEMAAELSAMNLLIQQETERLSAETAIMTPEQVQSRPDLVSRIQTLNRSIQEYEAARRVREQEFTYTERQAMRPVLEALQPILEEIFQENQLDILVDRANIVFASPDVDVSAAVIERLNAQLPSVSVNRVRLPQNAEATQEQ
ncbi:MAG: OmpH family outer membrane protein [Maricaulis sp.]|jgi:outer membrane protein|nr:OmpH family outer membrane protein [Maricaulis sp.]